MLEIQVALQLARVRGGLSDDPDPVPAEVSAADRVD
jgi:hypothetical protein